MHRHCVLIEHGYLCALESGLDIDIRGSSSSNFRKKGAQTHLGLRDLHVDSVREIANRGVDAYVAGYLGEVPVGLLISAMSLWNKPLLPNKHMFLGGPG